MSELEMIGWLPLLDTEGHPLTTFGAGGWHGGETVDVPELDLTGVDSEIAPLVLALNRAGIETLQSCQDLGGATGPDDARLWAEDVPRIGCVVASWESFPRLRDILASAGLGTGQTSGWLFCASPPGYMELWVSVLFPWRDAEAFLAACSSPPV